ncbi:permease (plasmid) [Gemmatirosa kalamazoonensis]|uniref:Permease n=1 Tax=Gemmatirosa kalamazoonensis TaxID=861299 RepID=W0RRQ8_9BACT|nr:ABC transporter permease [Gemmatirosa kalamazoonensis]AHG92253.1 permease [Gemmatirosa kalamazoonensis]
MSGWQRVLPARLRRGAVAGQVDDELAFHLEMRAQEYVDRGLTPEAARAEALRRMGDLERVRGTCRALGEAKERDMARAEWFEEAWQDLRFAARQLLRARALTAIAALTLALGIGATAAIFGVVDAVVLRPLPFDHPERIVKLRSAARGGGVSSVSNANFLDWRAQGAAVFEVMAAEVQTGMTLSRPGDVPVLLDGARASADWFRVFGARAAMGRTFGADDDVPGRGNVVVLADRTWQKYFHADPRILGRALQLNGTSYTVIGVMPASFDYVEESEALWVPLALSPKDAANRGAGYLTVLGRLRRDVAPEDAARAMALVGRRLAQQYPEDNRDDGISVKPFAADLTGDYSGRLLTLLGAVGFVLLIACANVANLLLARGASRAKELALRSALGAGRARLVRQLLTESVALALLGGVLGAALAVGGVRALVAIAPPGVPRLEQAAVDGRVLAFTLLLSVASSIVFGLAPALRAARPDLQPTLREGGRGTMPAVRDRLRAGLVVAEVALALVLLTGAGLLTRSAVLLHRVEPGFDPAGVLTARIMLPEAGYADAARVVETYRRIGEEVRRVPGVKDAGFVLMVPLADDDAAATVTAEGKPLTPENRIPVPFRITSGGYFQTMGIPIVRGRDFTDRDDATAPRVAIVNESLARKLWPGQDAIGKRLTQITASPEDPGWTEVVGVVRDVREKGIGIPTRAEVFYPVAQTNPRLWALLQRSLVLVARNGRGAGSASALERPLRAAVARIDPDLALGSVRSMDDYLAASLATSRFTSLLLGALSAIGLALAVVGIYGIIAYFVTQRVPEIGVRMALGATPRGIRVLVVRSAMRPVALGVVLGAAAAVGATRLLRAYLFGVTPTDPATIVVVVALLLGAALAASLVPARRAMRVDPATVARG